VSYRLAQRLATDGDEPFLRELFDEIRGPEFSALEAERRTAILRMQFDAQRTQYRSRYPDVESRIITADDEPVGNLLIAREEDVVRVLDVNIRPSWQSRGIGTQILSQLIEQASAPVALHVQVHNPARRLYERLGFYELESDEMYTSMIRRPGVEIPSLFANRPQAAAAYGALMPVIADLGPHTIEEKKTSIHVVAGRAAFLGLSHRTAGLRVTMVLGRPLEGERILKCERSSPRRYHCELMLCGDQPVDEELRGWLKEAYERVTS
jgi:GNAT superfamily N-acetyltransferase